MALVQCKFEALLCNMYETHFFKSTSMSSQTHLNNLPIIVKVKMVSQLTVAPWPWDISGTWRNKKNMKPGLSMVEKVI